MTNHKVVRQKIIKTRKIKDKTINMLGAKIIQNMAYISNINVIDKEKN